MEDDIWNKNFELAFEEVDLIGTFESELFINFNKIKQKNGFIFNGFIGSLYIGQLTSSDKLTKIKL